MTHSTGQSKGSQAGLNQQLGSVAGPSHEAGKWLELLGASTKQSFHQEGLPRVRDWPSTRSMILPVDGLGKEDLTLIWKEDWLGH